MRDLILFACCCLLGAAFWATGRQRDRAHQAQRQQELYQVGAPGDMTPSPERALLMGDFSKGLRAQPSPETYAKLAELFLVSNDLENGPPVAHAFNDDFMLRVVDKKLEFFDVEGWPLKARLWRLGDEVKPLSDAFVAGSTSVSLRTEGPWIVYEHKKRWLVLRRNEDRVSGFLTSNEVTVEGDRLTVAEDQHWTWTDGNLELDVE